MLSVPPTTIFCPAVAGCSVSAPVPETGPAKLISPAFKVSGLLPADKLESKAIVAFPSVKVTAAFNVTASP
ncbi:MAG: hypothetical protein EAZ10_06740 [Oscillatoriales cyanobacterium]|nr:MAG: hypothetical protein EAZ28_22110 [Oscillatoriales cyanobacterium]TAH28376.1 MAG: hypothetical protein EAZ10_06740 [Oscillatoriales cyanobacterium]